MPWELDNDRPIYLQLMERIQHDIISGVYKPGDKIPSVRDLALDAAVNPNTMQKAFAELERSGLITTRRTSGRFVTEDTQMIAQIRTSLAKEEIHSFLNRMKGLGYKTQDIIRILEDEAAKPEPTPTGDAPAPEVLALSYRIREEKNLRTDSSRTWGMELQPMSADTYAVDLRLNAMADDVYVEIPVEPENP